MGRSTLVCLATALAGSRRWAVPRRPRRSTSAGRIMRWAVDGVQREALVFGPRAKQGAARHPLVVAFHGHGGTMLSASEQMHIEALWPQAIVVYPQV